MSHINITEGFKNNLREWINLDDKIKEVSKAVKNIKNKKEQLTKNIILYMRQNNIHILELPDGSKLEYKSSKKHKPITKTQILKKLQNYFDDNRETDKILEFINDVNDREIKETESLSRRMPRSK